MSPIDHPVIRRFIEEAGNTTQTIGVGRVIDQIYAYLYFSEPPRTLDDMKEALGISKGSASMGVRQLEQWGAVQRVWVKGDRKDFYTANDYFGSIVRNIVVDMMGKRIGTLSRILDETDAQWNGKNGRPAEADSDDKFLRSRVQRLRAFQKKVSGVWNNPILKMAMR